GAILIPSMRLALSAFSVQACYALKRVANVNYKLIKARKDPPIRSRLAGRAAPVVILDAENPVLCRLIVEFAIHAQASIAEATRHRRCRGSEAMRQRLCEEDIHEVDTVGVALRRQISLGDRI